MQLANSILYFLQTATRSVVHRLVILGLACHRQFRKHLTQDVHFSSELFINFLPQIFKGCPFVFAVVAVVVSSGQGVDLATELPHRLLNSRMRFSCLRQIELARDKESLVFLDHWISHFQRLDPLAEPRIGHRLDRRHGPTLPAR